jgi:predicted permease
MRLIHRLRYLLQQRRHERELAEEIESHRQMVEDQQRAAGLSEEDARHAAHRLMGNATLATEDARGVWIATWVQSVFQDLGYAARSLRSQPGFTALALLALALGTGVNTSLFTLFNAIVPPTWPVRDPGRVVRIAGGDGGFSLAECRYLSAHTHALAGLAVVGGSYSTILDGKDDEPDVRAQFVGGNYFVLLGVDMALGRGFATAEDGMEAPEAVAVLSYTTWQTRYGGDPGIVGRQIRLHNRPPFTVIGVVNQKFSARANYHLWAPLASQSLVKVPLARTDPTCSMVARLAPGVSRGQARSELTILSRQFRNGIGKPPHDVTLRGVTRLDEIPAVFDPLVAMLLAVFGTILVLACANVGNLLLARSAARQREIAVRVCIGAGRARIVRQLLTESLLLAALGSGLGLLLAYVLPGIFVRRFELPPVFDLTPDLTVLAYAIAIAVFSALLFGLAPALQATRTGIGEAIKQQGTHASPRFPLRGVLLGVQVAISVTFLLVAGVLTRGLWHARSVDPGYKTNGVTAVRVILPRLYDSARYRAFFNTLKQQLKPFGNVGDGIPPPGRVGTRSITLTSEKTDPVSLAVWYANAGYFDVLGIPIVAGRNFVPADGELRNVLINEAMARRYWPGQTPIGQSIFVGGERREVVGVVRDAQLAGPGPIEPTFFEHSDTGVLLMPDALSSIATAVVFRVEPRARVTSIRISDQLESFLMPARVVALVVVSLGTLALLLATVGVYGVISYSVEQRRREIGVRMALGAQPREILGLVLRSNARAVVIGLAVGLAVFLAGSKVLESMLYGVSRLDPLAHGAVLAVLLAAAAAACAIPARRATRITPVEALRHD